MSLAEVRKISRHIVGPLVLLWLLCQSMVLCAGLMGNSAGASNESTLSFSDVVSSMMVMPTAMEGHHHGDSHGMSSSQADVDQAHHHLSNSNMASADCCDEQESYLSNSFFSSIVFLLFFPLCWLVVSLRNSLSHSPYYREPPPLYNYPRNHVFNCTFLN
ncbi:hypothetical protein [Alkalimarinus coralli]|uniref:hypothetical protein n=1 Tax=Alkalimarinus coralli TaxID=2935863 RepID=UPI00202B4691|nr:hypothetical protein [Alkalimarinus coralli]